MVDRYIAPCLAVCNGVSCQFERIEVVRGPNAASYGANSYFCVINILTQHLGEAKGNSVTVMHGNGSNGALYRQGRKLNDLSYRITASYREDNG